MVSLGRRALVVLAAALLATSCASPTLPLPPPVAPDDILMVDQGWYIARGRIPKPGRVVLRHVRSGLLFGEITEQAYEVPFLAQPGDAMQLWYTHGGRESDYVEFEVPGFADGGASGDAATTVDGGGVDGAGPDVSDAASD